MGFHSWLQPKPQDCATMLRSKVRATKGIRALRKARERHFADAGRSGEPRRPGDRAQYLRIATWNLREFDSPSYGYRSAEAKAYIAEILSHFDLIALQEIRRDLDALDDHAAAPRSRLGLHRHRLDRRLVRQRRAHGVPVRPEQGRVPRCCGGADAREGPQGHGSVRRALQSRGRAHA